MIPIESVGCMHRHYNDQHRVLARPRGLDSVQFRMISVRSEKPICAQPVSQNFFQHRLDSVLAGQPLTMAHAPHHLIIIIIIYFSFRASFEFLFFTVFSGTADSAKSGSVQTRQ